jgi:hypothetical protein
MGTFDGFRTFSKGCAPLRFWSNRNCVQSVRTVKGACPETCDVCPVAVTTCEPGRAVLGTLIVVEIAPSDVAAAVRICC